MIIIPVTTGYPILPNFKNHRVLQFYDNIDGFDENYKNKFFDLLTDQSLTIYTQYIFNDQVKKNYPNLNFKFDINLPSTSHHVLGALAWSNDIPTNKSFKNYICSFNGNDRPDRVFTVSMLHKQGWFNFEYSSKNFIFPGILLDQYIDRYKGNHPKSVYQQLLVVDDTKSAEEFYNTVVSFDYLPYDHASNIKALHPKINASFLQLVNETLALSYHPFTSEKFIQPIVCKSLWLAYAQPLYYDYLEKYYGFKKYDKIFNYDFDQILNPLDRLVSLADNLFKYSRLSVSDWHDLYLIEFDNIQYNYDWYFSGDYLNHLRKFAGDLTTY